MLCLLEIYRFYKRKIYLQRFFTDFFFCNFVILLSKYRKNDNFYFNKLNEEQKKSKLKMFWHIFEKIPCNSPYSHLFNIGLKNINFGRDCS